jgi:hypothetical protein
MATPGAFGLTLQVERRRLMAARLRECQTAENFKDLARRGGDGSALAARCALDALEGVKQLDPQIERLIDALAAKVW